MPQLAIPMGPFLVDEHGRLSFRDDQARPGFSFRWGTRVFSATLAEGRISLSGTLGRVPSTAGAGEKREAVFATVRGLPGLLPGDWQLRLMPDHRLLLHAEAALDWPASASGLVTPLAVFLLRLAPYLELLDQDLG